MKDVLFSVGRRLPDEDKIKLIDITPGIGKYVTTLNIDTEHDEAELGVGDLVKRLPNLRRVVAKTPFLPEDVQYNQQPPMVTKTPAGDEKCRRQCQVLKKLAEISPSITEFEGFCYEAILDYMGRARELNPDYDAGDVKEGIVSGSDYLTPFLETFPDVKVKLAVCIWSPEYEEKFLLNGRGHMIYDLELENGYTLRYELKSVRKLMVQSGSNLSSNLRLVPNVEDVSIFGPFGAGDPSELQSLLRIQNLKRLHLFSRDEFTEANFTAFQSVLMKPSLKQLEFEKVPNSERKLINAFLDCERNDFESLAIRCSVRVEDNKITIHEPIDFSLVKLFNKFKRIKEIIIEADNAEFLERIRAEINLIVEALPRNRSLYVRIGGEVFRY